MDPVGRSSGMQLFSGQPRLRPGSRDWNRYHVTRPRDGLRNTPRKPDSGGGGGGGEGGGGCGRGTCAVCDGGW